MKKSIINLLVLICFLSISQSVHAATVYLKSGEKIEGRIIEETGEYVKIEFQGVPVTYYQSEIDKIEKGDEAKLYDFKVGEQDIEGNALSFQFPGEGDSLYLFNLKEWKGEKPDKSKLVVSLYDKERNLITSGESVCVSSDINIFGSIALADVSRADVDKIAYFSLAILDCSKQPASAVDLGYSSENNQDLEKVYLNYLDAINNKSLADLGKYALKDNIIQLKSMVTDQDPDNLFELLASLSPKDLKNVSSGIKGEEGILTASATDPIGGGESKVNITFKKEDGVWKVDQLGINAGDLGKN